MENSNNDVSLVSEAHSVIIPAIPCSFPWKNHHNYKQMKEMSDTWLVARFSNLPGVNGRAAFTVDNLLKSAFHMLATLAYANGISERMPAIIKMIGWLFVIDNLLDDPSEMGVDLTRAKQMVSNVLTVFQGSYVQPTSPSSSGMVDIITDIAAEWWVEMCVDMAPTQKVRFNKAFQDYLESNLSQVAYRNARQLPDLDTYFRIRFDSSALLPCFVLIEHSIGIELDKEALTHPLLVALQKNVIYQIILVNDLTSFKKEYMQADFCNVVSIIYFRKLFHSTQYSSMASPPTLQEPVLEAWNMIKDIDQECVHLMGEIKKCDKLMQKPGMTGYLEGFGLWMSGNIYWHLVSGRYGICATTNLDVQPPDLLADHKLHIRPNEESTHFLPCGFLKP